MQKNIGFWQSASVLVTCVTLFGGCATGGGGSGGAVGALAVATSGPLELALKGEAGRQEKMRYYSASTVENHEEGQLTRRKEEAVEFSVVTRTTGSTPDHLQWEVETTEKDGAVNLHDLAFPELKEVLEMKIRPSGEVLYAGPYPATSVFFVPPIPLPGKPVAPGDTWTLAHDWVSMSSGIPLRVELVSIFKSLIKCGSGTCAVIEVSGDVGINGSLGEKLKFESEIKGYLLFAVESGSMVASRIANREVMVTGNTGMRVHSCMVGKIVEPSLKIPGHITELQCDPEKFSTELLR
ncbi:MAG: hypothetical protein IT288_16345 [Bdellovibrionales bacterium]|nr:hypothetical protein [Bdellovibrionales bacterium]